MLFVHGILSIYADKRNSSDIFTKNIQSDFNIGICLIYILPKVLQTIIDLNPVDQVIISVVATDHKRRDSSVQCLRGDSSASGDQVLLL